MTDELNLPELFGGIDIYLFDQLLKGRLTPGMNVLDAGCGSGRNLVYFLRKGFNVSGVDCSEQAIKETRALVSEVAPHIPLDNFRVETIEDLSFAPESFDVVLSSAVLHFAVDEKHWQAMIKSMWRVLKPGGIFFARLASTVGIEHQVKRIQDRHYHLPDGQNRFLVDYDLLDRTTNELNGQWLEPFKTVVVKDKRSMSNWLLRKK